MSQTLCDFTSNTFLLLLFEISFPDKVRFRLQGKKSVFVNIHVDKRDNLLSVFLGFVPLPDCGLYSLSFFCVSILLNFDFTPSFPLQEALSWKQALVGYKGQIATSPFNLS